MTKLEQCARALAAELGSDFDSAFVTKAEWNKAQGRKGGAFHDINEPFQGDYLDAARAVIEALYDPNEEMIEAGLGDSSYPCIYTAAITPEDRVGIWQAMLDTIRREG